MIRIVKLFLQKAKKLYVRISGEFS